MNPPENPKAGQSILEWAQGITEAVRSTMPRAAAGTRVRRAGTGFSVEAIKRPRGKRPRGKWDVYLCGADTSEDGYSAVSVKVAAGKVQLSEDWEDEAEIEGFDETEFELTASGHAVWLEMHTEGEGEPTFELKGGAAWEDFPAAYKIEEPESEEGDVQQWWYQLLAILRPPNPGEVAMKLGGTELVLEQRTETNLIVREVCTDAEKELNQLHPWH